MCQNTLPVIRYITIIGSYFCLNDVVVMKSDKSIVYRVNKNEYQSAPKYIVNKTLGRALDPR